MLRRRKPLQWAGGHAPPRARVNILDNEDFSWNGEDYYVHAWGPRPRVGLQRSVDRGSGISQLRHLLYLQVAQGFRRIGTIYAPKSK